MLWSRRFPLSLWLALGLYLTLALTTIRGVGVVGEVAIGQALQEPPRVALDFDGGGPTLAKGAALGPLVASQVRPMERLVLGPLSLPLAINSYTGGLPDWPARAVHAAFGSMRAVTALHVLLGAALLVLVHRFLRFHGTDIAAALAVLTLATDWSYLFYRKVLGGTEILLQAAALLMLWALWSRRWAGGRHGATAIAVGLGLGLMAKVTFLATAIALAVTALLTRRDRPALKAPPSPRWPLALAVVVALTAPVWIAALHQALLPEALRIPSHDTLGLQLGRALWGLQGLFEGGGPAREAPSTLLWYLADPLAWFHVSYGAAPSPGPSPWRIVGLLLLLAGSVLGWRDRAVTRSGALLRFLSVFAPLQLALLWLANRDLHHLAQATPTLCIWLGLALDRLAATTTPPRSPRRALLALVLGLPMLGSGALAAWRTDSVLESVRAPTFTEAGQVALEGLLNEQSSTSLWTSDYELYGMLELRCPELDITHAWGAVARDFANRERVLADLLRAARGGHYLAVRASAPMIYNLDPTPARLAAAAESAGVRLEPLGRLEDDQGDWARLFAIH